MKRISILAASLAAILGLASCECKLSSSGPLGGGDYLKTISLSFGSGQTRSTVPASEFAIVDATVFVYQTNGTTGAERLYETVTTESATLDVPLLFNSNTDFTYRFEAYANMGDLNESPSSVLFSSEESGALQMHGTLDGVDEGSSSSATISMERYAGRVVVSSVKLNWNNPSNASEPFTLKRIWLANTAEEHGGAPAYNVGGTQSASDMDLFLVSEVNQVIENKSSYDTAHYLYGYGTEGSALVLECEWGGETWYYHCSTSLSGNSSISYRLNIHQTGSYDPLGELNDDALVAVGRLEASAWSDNESDTSFGAAPFTEGAKILDVNGKLYTAAEWDSSSNDNSTAVGVAVTDGEHYFVVHPEESVDFLAWSNNYSVEVAGVFTTYDRDEAEADFAGASNTAAILAAVSAGTIEDAPAAQYCAGVTFANGRSGYLPSAGEVALCYQYLGSINECFRAINGSLLDLEGYLYWTSTQKNSRSAWGWIFDGVYDDPLYKNEIGGVRPVSAF